MQTLDVSLKYQLIGQKIGQPPIDYILSQRHRRDKADKLDPMSYRLIAIELTQLSGVDVTLEAVRRWHHTWISNHPAEATP